MLPWNQRPIEVANLFNPAFCALLLQKAIGSYVNKASRGLDYSLAFIVLPIVLHKPTRQALPTIATKLNVWMQRHHEVRIGFAERTQNLAPVTKEALIFALQLGALELDGKGTLILGEYKQNKYPVADTSEAAICLKKS